MELIYAALYKLRHVCNFQGYIHVKAIPGADPILIQKVGFWQSIWRLQMCVRTATVRSFILIVRWEISVVISVHFLALKIAAGKKTAAY